VACVWTSIAELDPAWVYWGVNIDAETPKLTPADALQLMQARADLCPPLPGSGLRLQAAGQPSGGLAHTALLPNTEPPKLSNHVARTPYISRTLWRAARLCVRRVFEYSTARFSRFSCS